MPQSSEGSPEPLSSIADLLNPRAVAVVGASRRVDTIGHQLLGNIIANGFTGAVYPVNPRAASVCAVRACPDLRSVPEPVDVAAIVVPKEHVVEVAEECGEAGVKGLIVISAGFREIGDAGAARERALLEVVRRHGMRMIGPNCMGIINCNPEVSLNATFVSAVPTFGQAAFVSQSGALGVSVLDHAREYGFGISQFVSVGNKADVSGNDLLSHWEHDPSVGVILMYVESFGNPARFLEIARRVTKTKPIIVVKSGRSRAGARAATSHTGALAASDTAVDALLAQAGVLRASSIEELFDIASAFEARALPRSRRTAVLTNAGGPGILAADALEAQGLDLVDLADETIEKLRPLFPAEASIRNPLDMIASATPKGYRIAMHALLEDPGIDAVLPIFVPPFGVRQEDIAEAIVGGAAGSESKPVLAVLMGRDGLPAGRSELHDACIPTYVFPESAARALAALNRQVEWAARPRRSSDVPAGIDVDAARHLLEVAGRHGRDQLTTVEALDLLRAYGVPVSPGRLARSPGDAASIAAEIGFPVALKLVSPEVVHKTELGAVRVGLASPDDARAAFVAMTESVRGALPDARIDGVLVQPMVRAQCETIVGMTRDPSFGPMLMFGLGGVLVEALGDVVFRIAPVDDAEAEAMIASIRGAAILDGVRGAPPVDRAALIDVIRRIGQLAIDHPLIEELDVNPLFATADGVVAVDARVRIAKTKPAPR